MNILCIGNSFSEDATRYLHGIARADGVHLDVTNLYIGGCSLERHAQNMQGDVRAYELQYNGHKTGFPMSLKEALTNRPWDIVTLQQVSNLAPHIETYEPYLGRLADYIRARCPNTHIVMHQTWAYEAASDKLYNVAHYDTPDAMLADIKAAYIEAASRIEADGIIPSGEMLASLLAVGIPRVHRDTFHASLGLGRYALGLLWYHVLCGASVLGNSFGDFDEDIYETDLATVQADVNRFSPIKFN